MCMAIHKLERQQLVKSDLATLWAFFSDASNLSTLTPPDMKLRITSPINEEGIYAGQIITYKVSPLFGIPMSWTTEITHVEHLKRFVDEQRTGPYTLWHHQHIFRETHGGVMMTDIVHYRLPLFFMGDIAHSLFVKQRLQDIFDFRHQKIDTLFNN